MNSWYLPKKAVIGGHEYALNTDFRDVLEILGYLNNENYPLYLRWQIAISLFFEGEISQEHQIEGMNYLAEFISYGDKAKKAGPKLLDWEQDAQMIIGDVNKVAGTEIRALKYLHWWTFLSYFYGIGEGTLSTIVSIRSKKKKGKKLEKWEEEYYKENREKVDFAKPETQEDAKAREYFDKWL